MAAIRPSILNKRKGYVVSNSAKPGAIGSDMKGSSDDEEEEGTLRDSASKCLCICRWIRAER
eukprot:CAMPEP_0181292524 /NCGR_PEP_ID=MMETSP1101-20121128/2552_1 /TAXON_ID=46948 /ORGANISM="Rhodomonas abbreviata, Strain Caron Lab Isolate" /LENGTH=61 /DNA_ID=CAMNT_0023396999 /DNA_START=532 /DNA_END=717 /DNA_ORIENTATION=+